MKSFQEAEKPSETKIIFAENMKRILAAKGKPATWLDEKCGFQVAHYLSKKSEPSIGKAAAIAKALDVSLDELCGLKNSTWNQGECAEALIKIIDLMDLNVELTEWDSGFSENCFDCSYTEAAIHLPGSELVDILGKHMRRKHYYLQHRELRNFARLDGVNLPEADEESDQAAKDIRKRILDLKKRGVPADEKYFIPPQGYDPMTTAEEERELEEYTDPNEEDSGILPF